MTSVLDTPLQRVAGYVVSREQLAAAGDDPHVDLYCERCRCCSAEFEDCWQCGGQGGWVDEDGVNGDGWAFCDECGGTGGAYWCVGPCDADGRHPPRPERTTR